MTHDERSPKPPLIVLHDGLRTRSVTRDEAVRLLKAGKATVETELWQNVLSLRTVEAR